MLSIENGIVKKVLTPQFLGIALVVISLPLTLILASTTQSLNQYASTYQSPLLQSAIQKQQAMIADQMQFLNELDQSIAASDATSGTCDNQNTSNTTFNSAISGQAVSHAPVDSGAWTANDDVAEAQDLQTEQSALAKADMIQNSSLDNPAVQLQKGANKLSLILDAVKAKTRRQKRHCRHHKKKGSGTTPSPSGSPTKSPKPTKTPKHTPSPSSGVTPTQIPCKSSTDCPNGFFCDGIGTLTPGVGWCVQAITSQSPIPSQ